MHPKKTFRCWPESLNNQFPNEPDTNHCHTSPSVWPIPPIALFIRHNLSLSSFTWEMRAVPRPPSTLPRCFSLRSIYRLRRSPTALSTNVASPNSPHAHFSAFAPKFSSPRDESALSVIDILWTNDLYSVRPSPICISSRLFTASTNEDPRLGRSADG